VWPKKVFSKRTYGDFRNQRDTESREGDGGIKSGDIGDEEGRVSECFVVVSVLI
jgi:hypothetical protein